MNNILNFGDMQAIILNEKLLKQILEEEKLNKKFEKKMDEQIKKLNDENRNRTRRS